MNDIISDKVVITRKKHRCCACGRIFERGTQMRTQINTCDGIQAWRECPTCTLLLSTHRSYFEDCDGTCYQDCVNEVCELGQTPEQLLEKLNKKL